MCEYISSIKCIISIDKSVQIHPLNASMYQKLQKWDEISKDGPFRGYLTHEWPYWPLLYKYNHRKNYSPLFVVDTVRSFWLTQLRNESRFCSHFLIHFRAIPGPFRAISGSFLGHFWAIPGPFINLYKTQKWPKDGPEMVLKWPRKGYKNPVDDSVSFLARTLFSSENYLWKSLVSPMFSLPRRYRIPRLNESTVIIYGIVCIVNCRFITAALRGGCLLGAASSFENHPEEYQKGPKPIELF